MNPRGAWMRLVGRRFYACDEPCKDVQLLCVQPLFKARTGVNCNNMYQIYKNTILTKLNISCNLLLIKYLPCRNS